MKKFWIRLLRKLGIWRGREAYLSLPTFDRIHWEDNNHMREFQEVCDTIDKLLDSIQGGEDADGNMIESKPRPLTRQEVSHVRVLLTRLMVACQKTKTSKAVTAVENALGYLGNLKRSRSPLEILLISKAFVETGITFRGGTMTETKVGVWESTDNRWRIRKVIVGRRALFDIYLKVNDEKEIPVLRCNRKGDAEQVISGMRRI